MSNKWNNTYQVKDDVDEEIDNIDDPFNGVNFPLNMDEGDDYECYYSRNDHDEGEYVNPEFINVHGHERKKANTKRRRKNKSKNCMHSLLYLSYIALYSYIFVSALGILDLFFYL